MKEFRAETHTDLGDLSTMKILALKSAVVATPGTVFIYTIINIISENYGIIKTNKKITD